MSYVFEGLDPGRFSHLFRMAEQDLHELGARRVPVDTDRGFPCRVSLADAPAGSNVLLVNHTSRDGDTPYRASHAIFVEEGAREAARFVDAIPPALATRQLSLRGFDGEGMMVDAMLIDPGKADEAVCRLFENTDIVEIDAHNAVRGCFAARAVRL